MITRPRFRTLASVAVAAALFVAAAAETEAAKKKDKKTGDEDPYADLVWPPPPDEARIKLDAVLTGRSDVEARSRLKKALLGASPQAVYDRLKKPMAVEFDASGRILVTDWGTSALIRFDRTNRQMDVLGTQGNVRLKQPIGLDVAPDGTIYVADVAQKSIVALDPEGAVTRVFGGGDVFENPTDVALAPDGTRLVVTDSKAHRVVVLDADSGGVIKSFGARGEGAGEFAWPSALTFGPEGRLFVVDQMNSRIQVFDADFRPEDSLGGLGVVSGNFVRPKDVAVDEVGMIYVTDFAFNNVQLFDADLTLLTFVGSGGTQPGRFHGASGVAVRGDEIAVVDQLGARVQVFRFLVPKAE